MVNPNKICVIKGDSITTPDVLRVKVGNVNVLDNDILGTLCNVEALALDDALASYTDETLVRPNKNGVQCSIVVLNADLLKD
jgi:hypothetical protein